jgi:hypothetical protein
MLCLIARRSAVTDDRPRLTVRVAPERHAAVDLSRIYRVNPYRLYPGRGYSQPTPRS